MPFNFLIFVRFFLMICMWIHKAEEGGGSRRLFLDATLISRDDDSATVTELSNSENKMQITSH